MGDPHIVSTLSEPAKISDNSAQNTPNTDSMMVSSNHLQSHNPNYRLSPGNNLSNIPHPHHHFNDMDDDIVRQGNHVKVHSSSAFLDDDSIKDTVIDVEEDDLQQQQENKIQNLQKSNEEHNQDKHVYKSNEKKRRT